jgi:HK97 family phage major capsid protein
MPNTQQLREQRANIWDQMQEVMDLASSENRDFTAEETQKYNRLETDLDAKGAEIERAEKHEARAAEFNHVDRTGVVAPAGERVVDSEGNTETDYQIAFNLWARFGQGELTNEQAATLRTGGVNFDSDTARQIRAAGGVGTGSAGGFTVPPEFRNALIERLKFYSSVRQEAEVITTDSGASLPWMTNNDTANVGAILGENTQVTEQDVAFGSASLDVYMYTSLLTRISLQLIQDSALDLNSFLPRKLGERIGRIQNQHFTTGTGTGQPLGLVTGGTAVAAATGNATSFTYDALVDATARLDPAYLSGGNLAWMGSQAALAAFRKLKDSQNRPLWEPSLQAGNPDNLLGYRFVLNNDMAAPAANAKSLAFGDFRAGYIIRDVTGVQTLRLSERYADFLQVGFLAFQRSGGVVQDTAAYTVLQNSAT